LGLSKLKRKLAGLLGFVLVAAVVIGLRMFNAGRGFPTLDIPIDGVVAATLGTIEGTGVIPALENENFILYLDLDTGNISLYNRAAGYTWHSRPTDDDMYMEEANELWIGNMTSPVNFTIAPNIQAVSTSLGNIFSHNARVSVYRLEEGIRVRFVFENRIEIGFDLYLTPEGFIVDIPPYLVHDRYSDVYLVDFAVFPFLGATRGDTGIEGYLFLPDGPGGLVNFYGARGVGHQFIEPVYGRDLTYITDANLDLIFQHIRGRAVMFPVFGIYRTNRSLMGVITQGESIADIVGNPAGVQTGFNSAHARFNFRRPFRVLTNAQTGEGFFRFSDATLEERRTVQYYFLWNGDASWVGMARQYRAHLVDRHGLTRIERERMPFTLSMMGGDITWGNLGSLFVPMTTFEQAGYITDYFAGLDNVRVILSGWQRRGNSVSSPNKYPAARQLGGDRGLRRFITHAGGQGIPVILMDNFSTVGQSGRGIRYRRDTVQNVQGFSLFGGWHLSAAASRRMFDSDWERLSGLGASGVAPLGFGEFLLTDFNSNIPMGRTTVMNAARDMAAHMADIMDYVFLTEPRAYLVQNNITFMNMPLDGSFRTMIDETVPFFPIALHGYVRYYGPMYNYMNYPERDVLRALSVGARPSFDLVYAPSETLRGLNNTTIYSNNFYERREEFTQVYRRFMDAYYQISGQVIEGFETDGELTVVTFETTVLYINSGTEAITRNGQVVPGMDFIVREVG